MPKSKLTTEILKEESKKFSENESKIDEPSIFGVTDGKAIGTYLEHKFQKYLKIRYNYKEGNSAKGIDFPELSVDMKVTSIKQPQSSCPFKTARQKIFGLGYSLLVFVYDKTDDKKNRTSKLNILYNIFVESDKTADYQTTQGLLQILKNDKGQDKEIIKEDLIAFMSDRNLPADEIELNKIANILIKEPLNQGYLTISNALQWRLQYTRVIEKAGKVDGITKLI